MVLRGHLSNLHRQKTRQHLPLRFSSIIQSVRRPSSVVRRPSFINKSESNKTARFSHRLPSVQPCPPTIPSPVLHQLVHHRARRAPSFDRSRVGKQINMNGNKRKIERVSKRVRKRRTTTQRRSSEHRSSSSSSRSLSRSISSSPLLE